MASARCFRTQVRSLFTLSVQADPITHLLRRRSPIEAKKCGEIKLLGETPSSPATVEGSRCETLKVPSRDPSTSLGMTIACLLLSLPNSRLGTHRFLKLRFFPPVGGGSAALEVLHRFFMLLRRRARLECSEISAFSRRRILLPRIQTITAGLKFSDHG